MKKIVSAAILAILVNGCAHHINIVARTNGAAGTATVNAVGTRGGPIQITLNGKEYNGSWVYMSNGGAIGISSANAQIGGMSGSASGLAVGMGTMGGGTVLASSADGSSLRCQFQYNQMGASGIGVCQDGSGEVYDMQIN